PSLAEISPCKDKNACCSTITQVDPCASDGSSFQSAPRRWQAFRFWTAESPACVEGKHAMFRPIPVEPTKTGDGILTLLWSPSCPKAVSVQRWAEIVFAPDGSPLTIESIKVRDSPLSGSYSPCGAKRIDATDVLAIVCRKTVFPKYESSAGKEFWSAEGRGVCCGTPNALLHRTEEKLDLLDILPDDYNRWGLPSVGATQIEGSNASGTIILPIMQSELADLYYDIDEPYEFADSGWVSSVRCAEVLAKEGSAKAVGPEHPDYPIHLTRVAVVDPAHFAWTFDLLAPSQRYWTYDGTEWEPALRMAGSNGYVISTGSNAMVGADCSAPSAVPRQDGYYFVCDERIASLDLDGNLIWAKDVKELLSEWSPITRSAVPGASGEAYLNLVMRPSERNQPIPTPVGRLPTGRIVRLNSTGEVAWTWEFKDDTAWASIDNMMHQGGILHVFGTLVPKTKDSAWAIHIRLDAKIGKELCPGQMPATP
ncbi:MAG: hypothetical protein H6747_12455, partial [Deltaproteobacteria bacterium]|nr:hypothetical protein [Deltaproteobacteria bacterium]